MAVDIKIPPLGESVSQGVIARWLKESGDDVAADEILLELETDKATMEIPAEASGRLEIVKPAGETVEVGTVVARIVENGGGGRAAKASPPAKAEPKAAAPSPAASKPAPKPAEASKPAKVERDDGEAPLSPAVRRLVSEHGLDPAKIQASGKGGRLTKEDVLRAIDERGEEPRAAEEAEAPPTEAEIEVATDSPAVSEEQKRGGPGRIGGAEPAERASTAQAPRGDEDEVQRVPMTRLRQRIAERLVEAQRTAAILTTFNEIDMSAVMELRKAHKERFQKAHGVGLGFVSLFARAVVLALRDVRVVNASIEGTDVVYHHRVHLGIAVGTERGLIVPVVRNADRMSLADLERAVGELAAKARDGKIMPDDLVGGTFTISNGGVYGSLLSTPILNPPQSGILGMHKIEERPVAVGGQVVVRPMMYVALSYDHRLVDGEQAVTFLVRVKERLEDPARMLLEI